MGIAWALAGVEGVDVLRHQQEVASTSRVPSLEYNESMMGLIRTCRKTRRKR